MKTITALLFAAALAFPAAAQDTEPLIDGLYEVIKVGQIETPDNVELTINFDAAQGLATLVMTLGDDRQEVRYGYSIDGDQIALEAVNPVGNAEPVEYDVRLQDGEVHLLRPRPEPIEEPEQEATEEEGAEESAEEATTEEAAEQAVEEAVEEAAEQVEEEAEAEPDTRQPQWVLKMVVAE